jgi:dienelactone hydrolase
MDEPQKNPQHTENKFPFCALCAFLRPVTDFVPVLAILLFLGALFWAREQDPFSRNWFTLKTADGNAFKCVSVLPKPVRQCPVIVYAHGSGGSLMNDGYDLRQMAEMGLAVVSLEYNQTNEVAFNAQLEALRRYLGRQKWADTNAVAWVGFSLGANWLLDFASQHPAQPPQLLVQLSGAGIPEALLPQALTQPGGEGVTNLHGPLLLIHGEQDGIFSVADTERFAARLQTNGVPVELKVMPGLPHGMEPERGVIFRSLGEYCRSHLQSSRRRGGGASSVATGGSDLSHVDPAATSEWWQNYQSVSRWQAGAPALWLFWLPAAAWIIGGLVWKSRKASAPSGQRWWRSSNGQLRNPCSRGEIALRWLAVLLAAWALAETALHLAPPHFSVSDRTLALARRYLVQSKERADFETLAGRPIWQEQKLKTLLDHVELAGYNRELVNWQLDDQMYRDFVLSPVITGKAHEQLSWRRPLWEEFYPRIRHESAPEDAATIVVRHLRERLTVVAAPDLPRSIPDIWLKQITDAAGFEIIYVAALRSVGVPARLDAKGHAEFWDGNKWQTAPAPSVLSW